MSPTRERPSKALRQTVLRRANYVCEYCYSQQKYSPSPFVVDHIIPASQGGKTIAENLAAACDGCNGKKGNETHALDPLTGQLVQLFHPRNDNWIDHFYWQDDYAQLVGKSPTGRASITKLGLNREHVINLRKILIAFKEHPPRPIS